MTTRERSEPSVFCAAPARPPSSTFITSEPSRPENPSAKSLPPATITSSTPSPFTSANVADAASVAPSADQRTLPSVVLMRATRPRFVTIAISGEPSPSTSADASAPRTESSSALITPSTFNSGTLIAHSPLSVPTTRMGVCWRITTSGDVVTSPSTLAWPTTAPSAPRISTRPFFNPTATPRVLPELSGHGAPAASPSSF